MTVNTTPDPADPSAADPTPEPAAIAAVPVTATDSPPSPAEEDDDGLQDSLHALSRLATSGMALEDLLTRVASYAVRAIPGADGAGLTLLEDDRSDLVVVTAAFVREVDNIQYSLGQGPCITAARDGQTVVSGSLGGDQRWSRFGGAVARLGVHSVLSLPLITADGVVGAMNVYARAKHVFDDRAAEIGEIYAAPAAVAVQNAHVLAQTQRLAARLQHALESRAVIERAVGIILSRSGGTETEALNRLRALSQHEHQKLSEVAQQIVAEARRRADARHRSD
ncbi:GAF and ANTAR domain-containing protein [Microlunatus ginsengisoli]|uniref:GAF and ANTAR domain-containing protein n=1 Tax=Microlunatus ginsengisoli TaxID=363863 RepID=A0ABP6ZLM6_9ACTN